MGRKNVHQNKGGGGAVKRLGRQPSLEGSENSEPPVHRPKESRSNHRAGRGGGGGGGSHASQDTFLKSRFDAVSSSCMKLVLLRGKKLLK